MGSVFALLSRYAVLFWNQGLHQGASLSVQAGERMAGTYKYPLYLCMLAFFLMFIALVLARTRTEIRRRAQNAIQALEILPAGPARDALASLAQKELERHH